ncbi:MAG: hypothetical protein ACKV2U_30815 [Bryobacteraceae bacterium]
MPKLLFKNLANRCVLAGYPEAILESGKGTNAYPPTVGKCASFRAGNV